MMSDLEYLALAYMEAENSNDPSTQVGAIIVRNNKIIASASNNFPDKVCNQKERWDKPVKYFYVEHAERNAIFSAAANGKKTSGSTMYATWFSCADCARAIIQAKIKRIVGHKFLISLGYEKNPSWTESVNHAYKMLDESGVERVYIEDLIGSIKIDGKLYSPKIKFSGEVISV